MAKNKTLKTKYPKEKDSSQELKETIRKLKSQVRKLQRENRELKSELRTYDEYFMKTKERIEELTEHLSLEEVLKDADK